MVRLPMCKLVSVALVGLLLATPVAGSTEIGFGVLLDLDSPEVVVELKTLSSAVFCYVDGDGQSSFGPADSFILSILGGCSGNSDASDLGLNDWGDRPAGMRLRTGSDANKPMTAFVGNPQIWYFDQDGDGAVSPGDTLYANLQNPSKGVVDVGDVRLSPYDSLAAGTVVQAGAADIGTSLALLGAPSIVIGYGDVDGDNQPDADEPVYVNGDKGGNEAVEVGDLRLSSRPGRTYGSFVTFPDGEGIENLVNVDRPPCFVDGNGSGSYSAGEPLFLDLNGRCSSAVDTRFVRLSTTSHGQAGTVVTEGDSDIGSKLQTHESAKISYLDEDGDGIFGGQDVAFLDVVAVQTDVVDRGDVQLTPTDGRAGGTWIEIDDRFAGRNLVPLGDFADYVAYVAGGHAADPTPFYINVDKGMNEAVEANDIRLYGSAEAAYGATAQLATGEVAARITSGSSSICTIGDDAYRAGDYVYLVVAAGCSNKIGEGYVRLLPFDGFSAGTVVRGTDHDHGSPTRTASGATQWKYFDATGDQGWSAGDVLYVDLIFPSNERVEVGDVRLSPFAGRAAGTMVRSGDPDVGAALATLGSISGHTAYVDANGDNKFGYGDVPYMNRDAVGQFATLTDVRLGILPEPVDVHTDEPLPTNTSATTSETTTTETTTITNTPPTQSLTDTTDSPTGQPGPTGAPTPSIGTVVSLLALLGIVVLARRRYEV